MLEQMINGEVKKILAEKFHHIHIPAVVKARVVSSDEDEDNPGWYKHILKIVDKNGGDDEHFPDIPEVLSRKKYEAGLIVATGLLYGELDPYIIGEAK